MTAKPTGSEASAPTSIRELILKEASKLFMIQGYDRTSIAMIAQRIGITPGALYWHFPSKDALLFEILESALVRHAARVRDAITTAEPVRRLRQFTAAHVAGQLVDLEEAEAYGSLWAVGHLQGSLSDDQRAALRKIEREVFDTLRDTLRDGIQAGCFVNVDVTGAAFAVLGIAEHLYRWYRPDGRLQPDDIIELYTDLVVNMVARHDSPG